MHINRYDLAFPYNVSANFYHKTKTFKQSDWIKILCKNATPIHDDGTYKYSFPFIFGQILYFWMIFTAKNKLILYHKCKPNATSISTGEKVLLMVF